MAQMTPRIQAHGDEIGMLALPHSRHRVVRDRPGLAICGARGPVSVIWPARKRLIAVHVAVAPETFSRTVRALSEEGRIEVAGDAVRIPDIERLPHHLHGH